MRETEVEEYEGQGEEGELEASCNIVSVRSWREVRARGRSVLNPLIEIRGETKLAILPWAALRAPVRRSDPQKHPAASRPSSWRSRPQPSGPSTAKVAAGLSGNRTGPMQSRRRSRGSSAR